MTLDEVKAEFAHLSRDDIMSPSCCGIRGLRRIRVGGVEIGLTGVDQTMETLFIEGFSSDDERLGKTFVERLREAGNYIPVTQEGLYAPVLIELFRTFCKAKIVGTADRRREGRG